MRRAQRGRERRGHLIMPMEATEIERLIKTGIPDAKVQITDLVGDKDHYAAVVISSEFTGKSKVQQHQIVYKALGGNMGGVLHALQLTTYAPK
jgi:stress-induced morphogen